MGYIYKVTNKINNKIYIGQTIFSLEERWYRHQIKAKLDKTNNKFYNAINKYGIKNFYPEVIEECPEEELDNREKYWITYYDSYNNGYNSTLGGEGTILYNHNEILKKLKNNPCLCEVAKEMGCCIGIVRKIARQYNISTLDGPVIIQQHLGQKVGQFDKKTDKLLNTFTTVREAARWCFDNNYSKDKRCNGTHINQVCQGKRKTAYGFKWKYMYDTNFPKDKYAKLVIGNEQN